MSPILLLVVLASMQGNPPDRSTQSGSARATYESIKSFVLRSADKMPVAEFGFQPTPDVRSFGQVLAHLADANYLLCSPMLGEENPNGATIDKIEREKLAREPLIERLKTSFGYCDTAYAALTEANIGDALPLFNNKRPRLALHWSHISHAWEHYGNLVTYLRLKGIVPPSSDTAPR